MRTPMLLGVVMSDTPLAEVYTMAPTMHQRERVQWRLAALRLEFPDDTLGVVALATAPLTITNESLLLDTADAIVQGLMLTYPGLVALLRVRLNQTHICYAESLTAFERRHPVEFSALYFQLPFLEKVQVSFERIAAHTLLQCQTFYDALMRVERATTDTLV